MYLFSCALAPTFNSSFGRSSLCKASPLAQVRPAEATTSSWGATDLAEAGAGGRALRRAGRWRETSTVPKKVYVRPVEDERADPFAWLPVETSEPGR